MKISINVLALSFHYIKNKEIETPGKTKKTFIYFKNDINVSAVKCNAGTAYLLTD